MAPQNAPMAELADAPDLGSGVPDVKVQVLFGAPYKTNPNLTHGGGVRILFLLFVATSQGGYRFAMFFCF